MSKNKLILTFLIVVVLLLLPLILKERSSPLKNFEGTQLSDLHYSEVNFINAYDQTKLAGMLFKPIKKDSFPIAIIIHGSGNSSRQNKWYLELVKHLQDNGIGVLLPDKRGCEKSEGNWVGLTIEELATDTEAAINFIKNSYPNNVTGVGLIGVSQGGWIAPVVGSKVNDLSFIANISGALTNGISQLKFEEINNIAQFTYKPIAQLISGLTVKNLANKESIKPFMDFNPVPYWKNVKTSSAFIVFGQNDTNCPVEQSLEIVKSNNLTHLKVKVYSDGKHAILNETKTAISDIFLDDIVDFIYESNSIINK
ncbi:alpha/beta hydrolase family protein [Croceitalea marina]|uniref:Alpha/beta hydrolase family protein n=1 Tax=Croceitalea marina TaxID=1775166 RepID=A0ABW5N0S6_9FLAO